MNTVDLTYILFNQNGKPLKIEKPKDDNEKEIVRVPFSAYEYLTGVLFNEGRKRQDAFELYMKIMRAEDKSKIELMSDEQSLIKSCVEALANAESSMLVAGIEQQLLWLIEGRDLSLA